MRKKQVSIYIFIFIICGFIFCASVYALGSAPKKGPESDFDKEAFIESAKTDKVLKIGLLDCVTYALKNNSEILIKQIEPKLKEGDVKIARDEFEPDFTASYNLHNEASLSSSILTGAATSTYRDINFNAGISGKITTGTEYNLEFLNQRYKSNSAIQSINPYYATEPRITITQPLFRGSGILVNKADITIAKNNKQQSDESFKDEVMTVVTNTKAAYYNYIYFLENYSIAKASLQRARDLMEINKARYEKGLISSVDLLESEAAVAQREKTAIAAESSLKKAEDELKLITNLVDDPQLWNASIEAIDRPQTQVFETSLPDSLQNAFKYRPDYSAEKISLKSRDIRIKVAQNELMPTLDLTGSFGLNGLDRGYEQALDKVDTDFKDWTAGVKFTVPWGGTERAKYDQRKLEKAQALIAFKRLEQNIILEVRDKVREVDIQHRQFVAAGISKEKESQNYEAQKERYVAGQVSTHDMLDYQDALAQAELELMRSLIDYNIAIINLDKAEGLTLAKNDIQLED